MTDLSPAAQAVLDAANGAGCYGPDDVLNDSRWIAAAALRAAADQMCGHHSKTFLYSIADYIKLNAIAAELEAQ
jgi:hypothetical protein